MMLSSQTRLTSERQLQKQQLQMDLPGLVELLPRLAELLCLAGLLHMWR